MALRSASEIIIDDGSATPLKSKGDGVQSLAALALVRHASESTASQKNVILALEEPESHLHPSAIHGLKAVLQELAEKQQIVLTTHCPLFVDRAHLGANVIVLKNKARPAKSVQEIRDILGVRASDNLRHAEIVLLVEGEEDRLAMGALLRGADPHLASAISQGRLAIDTLGGGSNLSYKVGLIRDALCVCHCFLDDDKAGREAFERARSEGLLTTADVNFCSCVGMPDAEIEDMFDQGIYEGRILNAYRVTLQCPTFKTRKKWSDRLRETFKIQGKPWDSRLESEVKARVAEAVAENPGVSLNSHKRGAFDALVRALTDRLEEPINT
jgi:predicted ATP-dependent endonuclease of OLD family